MKGQQRPPHFLLFVLFLEIALSACQPPRTIVPIGETIIPIVSPTSTKREPPETHETVIKRVTPNPTVPIIVPSPSPTRTLAPTATNSPVPISTQDSTLPGMDGRIYAWVDPGYYFVIEAPFRGHGLETALSDHLDPNEALLASFANFSDQVAYLTNSNQAELWLADLNLTHVKRVWSDKTGWWGAFDSQDHILLEWGPRDLSIILTLADETSKRTILYHLATTTVEKIVGACNEVGLPPAYSQPTLVCRDTVSQLHVHLAGDGSWEEFSSKVNSPPTERIQTWAFSPEGERILYVTGRNELALSGRGGQKVSLPFTYEPSLCCGLFPMREDLQWSRTGERILVHAKGSNETSARWQILDTTSDRIERYIRPETVDQVLRDKLGTPYDMVFSPDGSWVATSYLDRSEARRYMAIISLMTGQIVEISEGTADLLKWVGN